MTKNENYLITTFNNSPDLWYTKPPLQVWLQVLCINLLGYNELAIRLPSALAALFTCVAVLLFLHQITRSRWYGLIAGLVLVTCNGYVSIHGTRTGDVDALLTFFLCIASFSYFLFLEDMRNPRYLYGTFFALAGAILTKGVAGLFLLPAFFVFTLWEKKTVALLRNKHFCLGTIIFTALIAGFYIPREITAPGYMKAVWENEWLGRYGETLEGHKHDFLYYVNRLIDLNAPLWVYIFPLGLVAGVFNKNEKVRRLIVFVGLLFLQYLLLISFSETKPFWYDLPLYPFGAIITATGIYTFFSILSDKTAGYLTCNILPFVFLFLLFCKPYSETFNRVGRNGEPEYWDENYYSLSNYLKGVIKNNKPGLDGWLIVSEEYNGHILPYTYMLADKGQSVRFTRVDDILPGSNVFTHYKPLQDRIQNEFTYHTVDTFRNVKFYHIIHRKL